MFYVYNYEKGIKEYTVVSFLQTEKFKYLIKPSLLKLIKKKYRDQVNLFELNQKLTESLSSKLDKEDLKRINKNCSYLGKWSEFFIQNLVELHSKGKMFKSSELNLKENWEIIRKTTEESFKYFKGKKESTNNWIDFLERYMALNPKENKYSFMLQKESFERFENQSIFMSILDHFQSFVPYCKNYLNWTQFTKLHSTVHGEDKNWCEITKWEFDFLDQENQYIVDLKFQKKNLDMNWIWQLLLYVYLVDFYYGIKVKGITLINTFQGERISLSLKELFKSGSEKEFFELLKLEISDYEKSKFANRILSCFKEWDSSSNLQKIISDNFYFCERDERIKNYNNFIQQLAKDKESSSFLSNIHSPKWIWREWIKFSEAN